MNAILIDADNLHINLAGWTSVIHEGTNYIYRVASFNTLEILYITETLDGDYELSNTDTLDCFEVGSLQDCLAKAEKIAEGYGGWPHPLPAPPDRATGNASAPTADQGATGSRPVNEDPPASDTLIYCRHCQRPGCKGC